MADSETPTQEEEVSDNKGGLRTMPFIISNETFQSVASVGILPNMILYLMNGYHMDTATATVVLSTWSAASDFLAVLGAFISDSYFGRFLVISVGSVISVLGMTLLWLTAMIPQARPPPCTSTCENATFTQQAFLSLCFGFISIGGGCIRPCSMAFGADQFVYKGSLEKREKLVESYFNWYYASGSLSSVVALTVVVYIQDQFGMKVGFGVPAILMFLAALVFLVGSPLYVKMKGNKSLLTGLAQVPVAAFKNRHLVLPPKESDGLYYHGNDSNFITPSDNLRFLNKACIIQNPNDDFKYDGSAANPWRLCAVNQVETLKSLINILPIWSTGIVIYTIVNQTTIAVVQATSMDRHITSSFQIPAGSFTLFTALSVAIWVAFYDQVVIRLVTKYTGHTRGLSLRLRMGMGLFIACISMAFAAIVECIRRETAIQEGLSDNPAGVVHMSAMWLIPQYFLSGLALGMNGVGQIEYYYSELPKSMSSIAMAMLTLGTAFSGLVGSLITTVVNDVTGRGNNVSWLASNLNKGHYDYFYALLTFLCLLNFIYFLICSGISGTNKQVKAGVSNESMDLKETLLSKSREYSSSSSS